MTQFYQLSDNTALSNGWTHATKIYSESEVIIHDCDVCGRIGRHPIGSFSVDLEGETKYPDVLLCGEYPLLIVSENVIGDWHEMGVTGFDYYDVGIRSISSQKLKTITPKKYYHVVVKGSCKLDLNKMEVTVQSICNRCNKVTFDKPIWKIGKFFIDESTWDGSDLFISELFPSKVMVSEKVVISACKNKHTNFRFVKAEESMRTITQAIDYMKFCR